MNVAFLKPCDLKKSSWGAVVPTIILGMKPPDPVLDDLRVPRVWINDKRMAVKPSALGTTAASIIRRVAFPFSTIVKV